MIKIKHVDSVYIQIECDKGIAKELSSFFTFRVPNSEYNPAFRKKRWDGKIRLYNILTNKIYAGLLQYVLTFAAERGYKVAYESALKKDTPPTEFPTVYSNGKVIQPHDYQIESVKHAIENRRTLLISPTGSGKSLIIYLILLELLQRVNKKILIVVPTTGLVTQLNSDFQDYANTKTISKHIHLVYGGQEKETDSRVVISTWQSLYNQPEQYFEQFDAIIGDESHLFKAKSLVKIMTKLKNCDYRIGTTGTLDGTQVHRLVLEGLFGTVHQVTSTKELIDKEVLAQLNIECLILRYSDKDIHEIKRAKYADEIEWLVLNDKRNRFITNLANSIPGNVLVLFNFVDKHGIPLHQNISKAGKKQSYLICGKTDIEDREQIRKIVDKSDNSVLVASYGTCSTGINIKNIHAIIFASPSKSVVRVLQSIGRGLRKSDTKDKVTVFDLGDDLSHLKYRNHALRHLDERTNIYTNEEFTFKKTKIKLGDTDEFKDSQT
jgi:superfamily II DNA or RNA helicase